MEKVEGGRRTPDMVKMPPANKSGASTAAGYVAGARRIASAAFAALAQQPGRRPSDSRRSECEFVSDLQEGIDE
jgi:hypothetical protein